MHIVTFGNCQASVMAQLIPRVIEGATSAYISNNPRTGGFLGQEQTLKELMTGDIVLFQPLDAKHGLLSEAALRQHLSAATLLTFPYLFNSGLTTLAYAPAALTHSYGEIYGEQAIATKLGADPAIEKIIEDLADGDTLDAATRYADSIRELHRREQTIDVKLGSFVENNMQDRYLFITHNHPTNVIMCETLRQALSMLSLPYDAKMMAALEEEDNGLPSTGAPVTPADERRLKVTWGHHADWRLKCVHLIEFIAARLRGETPVATIVAGERFPTKVGGQAAAA